MPGTWYSARIIPLVDRRNFVSRATRLRSLLSSPREPHNRTNSRDKRPARHERQGSSALSGSPALIGTTGRPVVIPLTRVADRPRRTTETPNALTDFWIPHITQFYCLLFLLLLTEQPVRRIFSFCRCSTWTNRRRKINFFIRYWLFSTILYNRGIFVIHFYQFN